MNPQQIFAVLWARGWVVILVFGATVGVTALITALMPRQYTSTTTIVIDPKYTDVLGGASLGAQMLAQTHMATQMDILRSQRVAERVVNRLGIEKSPVAQKQWQDATEGKGSFSAYYADLLLKRVDVKPSRESTVIALSFTGADPQFAQQVADGFAQSYLETNLELRVAPAKQYAQWFTEQLKTLRADLERAQTRVSAFQQRNGIVGSDERVDIETARLSELSTQLAVALGQSVDARSKSQQAMADVRSMPDVSGTPLLQTLRADLVRAEAKLIESAQQYGTAHPTQVRMEAEVARLRESVATELQNASGTLHSATEASQRRVADLRIALDQQKARVLQIKQQRDEMSALQREAENAQRVFDLALQRFAQNNLESQSNQANAYVLTQASVPGTPSSPRVTLNLVLSAGLGLLFGIACAVLLELLDRRVRGPADVAVALQVPVLGSVPRGRKARRLGRTPPALGAPA